MSHELLPCPFCGVAANAKPHSQHLPGCYFDAMASLKAAPKGGLSLAPEVVRAWNRRATQPAAGEPEPFIVGNQYRTQAGDLVRFVAVHNEGKSYETMEDESGVNRYTRRDFGRCTGTAHDYSDPRNTPPLWTAQPAAGELVYQYLWNSDDWIETTKELCERQASLGIQTRTLWTAPPAAAHGDEAALWRLLEALRTATDRQALPGEFIRVMWEAGCDWINARAAMRAQGDRHD